MDGTCMDRFCDELYVDHNTSRRPEFKPYVIGFHEIFYTKRLMYKQLNGTPYPPRERPLSNALQQRDMLYLFNALTRFNACLDKIETFVNEVENNFGTVRKDTLATVGVLRKEFERALNATI